MSRHDEFKQGSNNPCTMFLEWKSDNKCFSFYDKENKENVSVHLPFKFLVLKELHTVKGFNDANQCGVFSNEVKFIGQDEINVRTFKGGVSVKGIYKEIKPQIEAMGGVYHKSIYAVTEGGKLINISIKGSSVQAWGDFTQKCRTRLADEWVQVESAEELTKGKIKYSIPVFKFDGSLTKEQCDVADEQYTVISDYLNGYFEKSEREEDIDDLDKTFGEDKPVF